MTYLEFKTAVKVLLTVDANRLGAESYVDQMIRQAVLDVQYFVPFYQLDHATTYAPADMTSQGLASVGTLPGGAKLEDAWFVQTNEECCRFPMFPYPWEKRYDLVCGSVCSSVCYEPYFLAIDPKGNNFYAYPALSDGYELVIYWDGLRLEFVDGDTVPFDEAMVMAVAEFVSAKVARRVNHDLVEHDSYMKSYAIQRNHLYVETKNRLRLRYADYSPATCDLTCTVPPTEPTGCSGFMRRLVGNGSPEGVVEGCQGDLYMDLDTGTKWGFIGTNGATTGWV